MALPPPPPLSEAQTRRLLAWYLGIRLVAVVVFVGGTIVYHLKSAEIFPQQELVKWLGVMIVLAALQTGMSAALLRRISALPLFVHVQLTWDLLFVLSVIYLTGGAESLYSFLFILVIVASCFFLPRSQVLIVASASAILYGSLLDLQYYRLLPAPSGLPLPTGLRPKDVFYPIFINVGAFYLTALLSGYLADRLRRSEAEREQRDIDYGELEELNEAILANITSGLMVIGPAGNIRSFNQGASRITGYRLEEVYNRPVEIFFPVFAQIDPSQSHSLQRGEARIKNRQGEKRILGYSASHVRDPQARDLGLLVTFQDLTEVKTLEEQLQRSDRLAAVGRLASGLAHEIRNPLASISGSIQMLREDEGIGRENRRLMEIVLKEVNRLNLLLGDFLNFARPAPLHPEAVDLAVMLDELADLLRGGGQLGEVTLVQHYPEQIPLQIDRQKMRQALWDLLLNAVEAARPRGTVRIAVNLLDGEIAIEDSGPGLDDQVRERIFEPFFTTKETGTGLGLANVYANIAAHGGRVSAEASPLGGARFVIDLPDECLYPAVTESAHGH